MSKLLNESNLPTDQSTLKSINELRGLIEYTRMYAEKHNLEFLIYAQTGDASAYLSNAKDPEDMSKKLSMSMVELLKTTDHRFNNESEKFLDVFVASAAALARLVSKIMSRFDVAPNN